MGNKRLLEMVNAAGARMAADLSQRLIPHPGETGAAREEVVRQFLRSLLPKRFEVSHGFLFDSHGAVSEQLDIIIVDATIAPRFEVAGGVAFYPCETAVAVGQIKTNVTSKKELWAALVNLRSATLLDRSAGGLALCSTDGEPIDNQRNYLDRLFTFVFVADRALSPDNARSVLVDFIHRTPPSEWPNIIFGLNKYLITYCCDSGVCPNPMDARGVALTQSTDPSYDLLRFYILLSQALVVTRVARMSSFHYLGSLVNFESEVVYSATDSPPPLLSSLNRLPWRMPYDTEDDEAAEE